MSVTRPKGFIASGISCGIKDGGRLDLSLVVSVTGPIPGAATFTTNKAAAAPVQISKEHLVTTHGMIAGVILNSGGANAATGPSGLADARQMCAATANELDVKPEEILVCSTGLIGFPLPMDKIEAGIKPLVASLGGDSADGTRAATAILTTDTHDKQVLISGDNFSVGGMVKGAGMIGPNMATMLCVLTTDAEITPEEASSVLKEAVGDSFNELIIDGCTSTNDTVILLASGLAGPIEHDTLVDAVSDACQSLARLLAEDAEGATKVATIKVTGAASKADARLVARGIALSLLVKTSLYGADPYWGRIVSEVGASGAEVELTKLSMSYGPTLVFQGGEEVPHEWNDVSKYLEAKSVEISCDLGLGDGEAQVLTTDIGHGYIDENMRTS